MLSPQEKRKLMINNIQNSIKNIPNYPKPGILFRDITSLLANPVAYADSVALLVEQYRDKGILKL